MSKFARAEDAIDHYDAPTYYCQEPGCDWAQESEWNVGAMAAAKQAGIDHWNAVHKAISDAPDRSVAAVLPGMELVGRTLTAQDPEPPLGSVVSCMGNLWYRLELSWERMDGKDDPESWTKIAGNYGPVIVVVLGGALKATEGLSRLAKRSPDPPEPEKGIDYAPEPSPWTTSPRQRS